MGKTLNIILQHFRDN